MEKNIVVSSGTSFTKLLAIAFIILKILGIIEWSWLWVLSPIWIPIALVIIIIIIGYIIASIMDYFQGNY